MAYTRTNLLERIRKIQEFARQYYEPGRHDRSWYWVWSHHVQKEFHISYRTFQTYMATDVDAELEKCKDEQNADLPFYQQSLFSDEEFQ